MIELNKTKDLDKYIEYVNAQRYYTSEELKADLAERCLSEQEIDYVMTFYKPKEKQGMFKHPFSFNGRIRRKEYGLSIILMYIYAIIIGLVIGIVNGGDGMINVLLIPIYWFIFAQGAKRCHDRGNSGWYQINPFYGLWMLFGDGDECENEYGVDPKGRG